MTHCDLLIRGGQVIDGTGAPAFAADIAISRDEVIAVGEVGELEAGRTLEAAGKVVCPGFIDLHSHSDFTIFVNPAAESKVRQGVTTEVNGQCGFTPFPVREPDRTLLDALCPFITAKPDWQWVSTADYLATLAAARPSINVAQMVGHSALRAWVMGFESRPATAQEREQICAAAEEALAQGAIGVSVGLAYALGMFAETVEIEALAHTAARNNAHLSVHLRDEGPKLLESLAEVLGVARRVSERTPLRLQIDHLKAAGEASWGKVDQALELIEQARIEGLDVAFDVYPYTAGSRHLSGSLPGWVHDGGNDAVMRRLRDPAARRRLHAEYEAWLRGDASVDHFPLDAERTFITGVATDENRWAIGRTLAQVAQQRGQSLVDATLDLLVEEQGHVSIVAFVMNEDDMQACLRHPLGCIATDGLVFAPYGPLSRGRPHPRSYGTFPRAIGRYARDQGLMPLEEAVRKCTSLPASRLGLTDRGVLQSGARADLVVFDPATIIDLATFEDPHQYAAGIEYVIVNGEVVIEGGANRNPGSGRILRR